MKGPVIEEQKTHETTFLLAQGSVLFEATLERGLLESVFTRWDFQHFEFLVVSWEIIEVQQYPSAADHGRAVLESAAREG